MESKTSDAFSRLSDILDTLRRECPWDRVQTMKSLRYLTIEEVHELSEAIVAQSPDDIKKELGDLAMHVMFYAKIAEEQGLFTMAEMYDAICEKLIARHPFIYRKDDYHGESWEQLKMREGRRGVLDGVPHTLPTLVATVRMQEKVSGIGDKEKPLGTEVGENISLADYPTEEQFGDLLFALVDYARRHGINADDALAGANRRFRETHSAED